MNNPDNALQALLKICNEFKKFCDAHGGASEADTRVKIIDRILEEVLYWPESEITREEKATNGFMDYVLRLHGKPHVTIEAKKEGVSFVFPITETRKFFSLSGALLTDKNIAASIMQVRKYCDDESIRYAIATNGYAWIIFRAIRDDIPWRKGMARVFQSLDKIKDNFTEFWNLLSYEAITHGSLDSQFGPSHRPKRELHRVTDRLFNADSPLQRNRLNAQLHPLIRKIFEDIADQDQIEILQSCYIYSGSLKIISKDLDVVITDSIPRLLRDEGTEPILQKKMDAGVLGESIADAIKAEPGQLFLLLGGIGSGKTTLLKRYQRTVGREILENNAVWFHIDFLKGPLNPYEMEHFVWQTVLEQLRSRYNTPHMETRRDIKRAFREHIDALKETALIHIKEGTEEFEKELSPYLEKWQEDLLEYVPRLLSICRIKRRKGVVFFIDNVDQLSPDYQAQIFLLGQRITRIINAITVIALREESYYTASIQKTFTAYTNRKFHIASPRFSYLIGSRITFALQYLEGLPGLINIIDSKGISIDKRAIADLLKIVQYSIFEQNKYISSFIETICYGNMRRALQMFTTFLVSGVTDVDKMLNIYRRDGAYYVAFHEFVKSIMLEDRRYYKESHSQVMNLFNCGNYNNSGHFTSLRVLRFLLDYRSTSSREGKGFCDLAQVIGFFEDVFDNREDLITTINALVARQLVEANDRSTEDISHATHIRITSAGWYYLRHLVFSFAYLDLVLQDTPFNDDGICKNITAMVSKVDNLSDKEDDKLERMTVRFVRVESFLNYLENEENNEFVIYDLESKNNFLTEKFMPEINKRFMMQKEWISRRLKENREKYSEELLFESFDAEEKEILPLSDNGVVIDID